VITAKVTSKGQITIPKQVRTSLHLHTGDRVSFVVQNDSEAVIKPVSKSVDKVFGMLHRPDMTARTVEEMDEAIAEHVSEKD
jgi:antitoxin PrlF